MMKRLSGDLSWHIFLLKRWMRSQKLKGGNLKHLVNVYSRHELKVIK